MSHCMPGIDLHLLGAYFTHSNAVVPRLLGTTRAYAFVCVWGSSSRCGREASSSDEGLLGQETRVAGVLRSTCHGARRGEGG